MTQRSDDPKNKPAPDAPSVSRPAPAGVLGASRTPEGARDSSAERVPKSVFAQTLVGLQVPGATGAKSAQPGTSQPGSEAQAPKPHPQPEAEPLRAPSERPTPAPFHQAQGGWGQTLPMPEIAPPGKRSEERLVAARPPAASAQPASTPARQAPAGSSAHNVPRGATVMMPTTVGTAPTPPAPAPAPARSMPASMPPAPAPARAAAPAAQAPARSAAASPTPPAPSVAKPSPAQGQRVENTSPRLRLDPTDDTPHAPPSAQPRPSVALPEPAPKAREKRPRDPNVSEPLQLALHDDDHVPQAGTPAPPSTQSRVGMGLGIVVVLGVIGIALWALLGSEQPPAAATIPATATPIGAAPEATPPVATPTPEAQPAQPNEAAAAPSAQDPAEQNAQGAKAPAAPTQDEQAAAPDEPAATEKPAAPKPRTSKRKPRAKAPAASTSTEDLLRAAERAAETESDLEPVDRAPPPPPEPPAPPEDEWR